MLGVTTAIALFLGVFYERVRNERRAADAVAAAYGKVIYDWQVLPEGADPSTKRVPPGPEWLRRILGPHWLESIVEVRLNEYGNRVPANDLKVVGPHLARLSRLRTLSLWGGDLDRAECELLAQTGVEDLTLNQKGVLEPETIESLAKLRRLKRLSFHSAKVTPAALEGLAALPGLERLRITCDSYDPQTGDALRKHYLRDEHAEVISKFPSLRSVSLFHTEISDAGVEALCRLSQLELLTVSSPEVTSASFKHVAKLKELESLSAWQWKIDNADFQELLPLPKLVCLDLLTELSDESVPYLLRFKGLERLRLRGEGVTEACVPLLCTMRGLTWLNLDDTSIHKESDAAAELKRSLPGCMIRLPKTEEELERERQFHASKWGGGIIQRTAIPAATR